MATRKRSTTKAKKPVAKKKPVAASTKPAPAPAEPEAEESPPPKVATPTEGDYTVTLQLRHGMYIERLAQQRGTSPGKVIEWCVRQEWARDPYKAGAIASSSSMPAADGPKMG